MTTQQGTSTPPLAQSLKAVGPLPAGGCTAVVGLQWGDEGKGKAVDLLAADHHAVARFNGGANAGHSVVVAGERFSLHLVPSGILYPSKLAIVGNGVVVDPWKIAQEINGLRARGVDTSGLRISDRAHVVLPYHKAEDAMREDALTRHTKGPAAIGTTRRGIGPAYADKVQRACAVRIGDLLKPDQLKSRIAAAFDLKAPILAGWSPGDGPSPGPMQIGPLVDDALTVGRELAPMICDTTRLLHDTIRRGDRVLFEGANGSLLDVDHGTYPFVTGSSCVVSGVGTGTGVPNRCVGRVLGVMKAYSTRVGAGPLPTELHDDTADRIRQRGREFGTTTGRPRRVGWLDLVAVRYSVMINGVTGLCLTLLDVLGGFDTLKVCTAYEINGVRDDAFPPDAPTLEGARPVYETVPGFSQEISAAQSWEQLPEKARTYVRFIEDFVGVPVEIVSVGPGREQTILRV
ncbi:MAG: adenylosuccinate synthase [Phycisphaeraceae bacterium]|nr:adenylosuccinate synthase [Phycisphaeraceae bacterium]